ncbi:MAG: LytTR family DNA-binding domain-containing protein [Streptococcaceae bacterium]|jgi:DNA-binding LytR/AlgR family response regulator|nr:LytTR family DNA-binding domain-containing protein [Streptococcaceae bacterium]
MKLRVAICDDEPYMANKIEDYLHEYDSSLFDVLVYYSSSELINVLENEKYDFFILDIEMPYSSGIELAQKIREKDAHVPIVFMTSYREYMEEVFQLSTFDYVIKPISIERVFAVFTRVLNYLGTSEKYFQCSYNKVTHNIFMNEIIYFEKRKRQVQLYTTTGTYVSNLSTKQIINKVTPDFVQIHTSYIINVRYIKDMGNSFVLIRQADGTTTELILSRKYKETARKKIMQKMKEFFQ